ncbi:MAG: hypothetical protein JWP29_1203 [Rhodoferax sp.]|nr:hypothetical protein [Rhodoferax sp.]
MAQDEPPQPSGLFSKVVKFVRNPTMNWSDLDQPEADKESVYSKQMLKEMIERKRRNDFVRRREFDQLRKLRQREALTGVAPGADDAGRPSFFQSSLPSKSEDRAGTLKKIDEIEAQMSMQWWKSKDVGASTPVPLSSRASLVPDARADIRADGRPDVLSLTDDADVSDSAVARHYAPTVPASLPGHLHGDDLGGHRGDMLRRAQPPADSGYPGGASYAATEVSPLFGAPGAASQRAYGAPAAPVHEPMIDMLAALNDSLELDYDAAPPESADVPDFVHAPELEEAAIRFANGDDAGAEAAILAVLDAEPEHMGPTETWMTLFDLYRATNQQDRFDTVGIDFATRFGRSAPPWFSMPALAGNPKAPEPAPGQRAGGRPGAAASGVRPPGFNWSSPSIMGASAVLGLQSMVQSRSPQTLRLNWDSLLSLDVAALDGLSLLLADLADQQVQLVFADGERLEAVVKAATRSGDRSVNQAWWRLRLELLRIMQRPDEFDLVALEYCITYEVSPPSWRPVRCEFSVVHAGDYDGMLPDDGGLPAEPEAYAPSDFKPTDFVHSSLPAVQPTAAVGMGTLSGLVLGDATQALASMENAVKEGGLLVISCDHLMRIDFSAAGSVLNWAATQQGAGRRVEFRGLHRLVAIFFNVIGINENAKIIPRRN